MKSKTKKFCPITQVILLLSDKWTMLVMRSLREGPKRFSELEKWLEGISTRTLTLKLKRLMDEKLIEKTPQGTYAVTKKGSGLKIIERAMISYKNKYLQ